MPPSTSGPGPWANWADLTGLRFGAGRISELAAACRAAQITRPILVTDGFLARYPIKTRALGTPEEDGLLAAVFSAERPNPRESSVAAWRALAGRMGRPPGRSAP